MEFCTHLRCCYLPNDRPLSGEYITPSFQSVSPLNINSPKENNNSHRKTDFPIRNNPIENSNMNNISYRKKLFSAEILFREIVFLGVINILKSYWSSRSNPFQIQIPVGNSFISVAYSKLVVQDYFLWKNYIPVGIYFLKVNISHYR